MDTYINSVNLNSTTEFPYLVLDVINDESRPRNPGFQVMHWHEDLQFVYVLSGAVEVATLSDRISLRPGEGAFINKNVVHTVRKDGACHYNSFIFPDRFVKFYPGGPAERLVDRIVGQSELPVLAIRSSEENRPALQALRKLSRLGERKNETDPYEVLVALCGLWLAFSQTVTVPERQRRRAVEERTAVFLQYIARHYGEEVSLNSLAASANVSPSECLRCFKAVLHTTPYHYLMEYRLSKAAEQLRQTEEPISAIAAGVGFNHLSHFGRCFREKTGLTPGAYRKIR